LVGAKYILIQAFFKDPENRGFFYAFEIEIQKVFNKVAICGKLW
jgi:hypothetical protein